jgi:phosphoglycolate phosphatase-like HAD superfamily hydrolase
MWLVRVHPRSEGCRLWQNVGVIECLRPGRSAGRARVVLFDFDGTISTIRSGWMDVMVRMMVEILSELRTGETELELTDVVVEFVGRLTGKQTMYQMIELAENVSKRGGHPPDPLEYKKQYLSLLHEKIADRLDELRSGKADPDTYMVPGARAFLEALRERGLKMYLASGTDQIYMREEASLLDVAKYFDGGVFGALDDYKSFSKRILIQRLIAESEFRGDEFLGFGDGYVEIENIHEVNGVAVGVATDEPDCLRVDEWKRERLVKSGADFIIPNFLGQDELLDALFSSEHAISHV